jgi:hypothetical protein
MIITQVILPSPDLSYPHIPVALNYQHTVVVGFRKYQNAESIE